MLLIAGIIGYQFNQPANGEENLGFNAVYYAGDVIGSKVGTTTTGVDFGVIAANGRSATSTYVNKIGNNIKQATYTFKALKASSTADMLFAFEASNDQDCNTASSTTSISDMVLTGDVNWFSIPNNFTNKVHATSLSNASTTLPWSNPQAGQGTTAVLDNLNYECLRLSAQGSSTQMWAQIKLK